jgi:PBP1b-binding outer membrane lipoprotein LpoB
MNILRPQVAFTLLALALTAMPLVGCKSSSQSDDETGPAPSGTTAAAAPDLDVKEVTKEVGLNAAQEAKLTEMYKGGGRHKGKGGGKHGGRNIERRVKRMTEALDLTPQQAEKLRALLKAKADKRAAKQQPA